MRVRFLTSPLRFPVVLFLAAILFSCAQGNLPKKIESRPLEEKTESRDGLADTSRVEKIDVDITLSLPVIRPVTVTRGNKVTFQMNYMLSSTDKAKEFDVIEVIALSGAKMDLQLSRKASRKAQGSHVLTLEFGIPPDLPPGSYQATGIIRAEDTEKKGATDFTVKRRK
ncbi:MAG TPA: hypothetical protein VGJ94_14190 [Syntrophorhabdaceae bacterium]|jgi:hypothetical protein